MIPAEDAKKYLEQKTLKNLDTLRNERLAKLPADMAHPGSMILHQQRIGSDPTIDWYERLHENQQKLREWLAAEESRLWQDKYFQILEAVFGDFADYVRRGWEMQKNLAYETDIYRRSFRAPCNPAYSAGKRMTWLTNLLYHLRYDFTLPEYARYLCYLDAYSDSYSHLLAAAIDAGTEEGAEVLKVLLDTVYGRDEIGGVSRNGIKALLLCSKPEAHEAVEKLLLSAQRQEGLRQSVLECLDETSPAVLRRFMKLIVEHKLVRFSSVMRAIDVWFGFGWNSGRQKALSKILENALHFLENPAEIPAALDNPDNLIVYTALWTQGVEDIEGAFPLVEKLLQNPYPDKQATGLYFLRQTNITAEMRRLALPLLTPGHLPVAGWVVSNLAGVSEQDCPEIFSRLETLLKHVPDTGLSYQSQGFAWLNCEIHPDTLFSLMLQAIGTTRPERLLPYFPRMDASLRSLAAKALFAAETYSPEVRVAVFSLLDDKSVNVREEAFKALSRLSLFKFLLTPAEVLQVEARLETQSTRARADLIAVLLRQDNDAVLHSAERLLSAGKAARRLAGLELLVRLQSTQTALAKVAQLARSYAAGKRKISAKEQMLVDELLGEAGEPEPAVQDPPSVDNAFGLNPPGTLTDSPGPQKIMAITLDVEKVTSELRKLDALFEQHKDHEYCRDPEIDTTDTVLLGNHFPYRYTPRYGDKAAFEKLPLAGVWQDWWKASGLEVVDLFKLSTAAEKSAMENAPVEAWLRPVIAKHYVKSDPLNELRYTSHILRLFEWISAAWLDEKSLDFLLDVLESLFASIPAEKQGAKAFNLPPYFTLRDTTWRGYPPLQRWEITLLKIYDKDSTHSLWTDVQKNRLWHLLNWKYRGTPVRERENPLPLSLYLDAVQLGQATAGDLRDKLLHSWGDWRQLTGPGRHVLFERYAFLEAVVAECRERVLDIELARDDEDTPATEHARHIAGVPGIPRLAKILTGLGKEKLQREYFAGAYGEQAKRAIMSALLKVSYPEKNETQAAFDQALAAAHIPEQRLVETAVYTPAWAGMLENYLGWPGLESAVWWLHAHTKEYDFYVEQKWENHLKPYTPLSAKDLVDGAVDVAWFKQVYAALGKTRWDKLYAAAKYASEAAGHRRAQLFADSMTGQCPVADILEKIHTKRNKDAMRALGLAPLDPHNPEQDTLRRYQTAVQFRKESKQFGSLRQTSEALAVRICLENLARTAGFSDPIRLTWTMESREVAEILAQAAPLTFDNTTIALVVDDLGKATIEVKKAGKSLKSIPAAHRKKPQVQQLQAHKKTLAAQYARARQALEEAMNHGDVFSPAELRQLARHPVVAPMLNQLVWVAESGDGDKLGFPDAAWQQLIAADNTGYSPADDDKLRLAHCTDLHASGAWRAYQHACFSAQRIQPFKQVFRELYLLTEDEKAQKTVSRRYAGHQIQPKQAAALLKSRGWHLDYEGGGYPEKVFHHESISVVLSSLIDWFTPVEVEAPTLETVEFVDLDTWHNVPFEKIHPRTFSEVMRDLDLVVSVAHAGGTDPETSHSTIEMRAVLIRETAMLLSLDNLELKSHHALIHGKLGDYSVHLGSGTVHRRPGGALSILPVHSARRGRIFLPFADEDPKSAEIVSKVLLLARDDKIQDPTILRQLN